MLFADAIHLEHYAWHVIPVREAGSQQQYANKYAHFTEEPAYAELPGFLKRQVQVQVHEPALAPVQGRIVCTDVSGSDGLNEGGEQVIKRGKPVQQLA